MQYLNPWSSTSTRLVYFDDYDRPPVLEYKGVKVINIFSSYDYVYNGVCITQRVGMSNIEDTKLIIDAFLFVIINPDIVIKPCVDGKHLQVQRMHLTYLKALKLMEKHNEK